MYFLLAYNIKHVKKNVLKTLRAGARRMRVHTTTALAP